MCRGGYSPKIDATLVKEMYQIKLKTGKSLVQQANEAVVAYLTKVGQAKDAPAKEVRARLDQRQDRHGQVVQETITKTEENGQ